MGKIYDCFNFFNELDILEIRLNTLYDHVDYFVIVESSVTHSGVEKPFYFEENRKRYLKFEDKIINFKVLDTPSDFINIPNYEDSVMMKIKNFIETQTKRFNRNTQLDYGRDFFQKECIKRPLVGCEDEDVILISDADEIPNPSIISNLKNLDLDNKIYSLNQITYYYYLNVLKQKDWYGTRLAKYKNIKELSVNEIRGDESISHKLDSGGWHFSFMGGIEKVKEKILSYSARDLATPYVLSSLEENINNNVDPFFRGNLSNVNIDETYPEYLIKNINKYEHLIRK